MLCTSFLVICGCVEQPKPYSKVADAGSLPSLERISGALEVGGCECKQWQPGVTCDELSNSDIPPDNKYYVTTFGGPGDSQDMWICGHKTTDNGSWPYAAGYARFGCTKIMVINPANGKSCIAEVADCGPNRCVEEAACFCNCQGHHPVLDVSPFITQYLFGISSSGWSEKRVVIAYPVDPATPIGCPGGPVPLPDKDGDGFSAAVDCDDNDASVNPEAQELCNGKDDDCDGLTDEDFPGLLGPCSVGVGECARFGLVRCSDDGLAVVCDAVAGEPHEEICDGLDNDCDGLTDEIANSLCSAGFGQCLAFGFWRCRDGVLECDAIPGMPQEEVCDGLDNDCDGLTDEGVCIACRPNEVRPCEKPDGTPGVRICGPQGYFGACIEDVEWPTSQEELAETADQSIEPDASTVLGEVHADNKDVIFAEEPKGSTIFVSRGSGCSSGVPVGFSSFLVLLFLALRRNRL